MTNDDWKTLRVPADKYHEAKEQKEADGRTWGEQIVRPDSDKDTTTDVDVATIVDAIGAELPNGSEVDSGKLAREVSAHLDYVELANKTADELEARL
jgi:hypothetical protein